MYYRYGILWETFFKELGFDVVVSDPTNKDILDIGDSLSNDEVCIGSKIYLGHVQNLIGKCDAIFVPGFGCDDVRAGFCTRYQSLPDLVRNTFRDTVVNGKRAEFLTIMVSKITKESDHKKPYIEMARKLGINPFIAAYAWKRAFRSYHKNADSLACMQLESLDLMQTLDSLEKTEQATCAEQTHTTLAEQTHLCEVKEYKTPMRVLVVAHPYIYLDDYVVSDVIQALEQSGAFVLFADHTDKQAAFEKSFEFSETLPWIINRELVGSVLLLKDKVDGIVVISAFPCGPDSLFIDELERSVDGIPMLRLTIDSQNAMAGVQTRIESFMDILSFKGKGGYLDA